jgi:hypothetical protein
MNLNNGAVVLQVIQMSNRVVIGNSILIYKASVSVQITSLVPSVLVQNLTGAFVNVIGSNLKPDCKCVFGLDVSS